MSRDSDSQVVEEKQKPEQQKVDSGVEWNLSKKTLLHLQDLSQVFQQPLILVLVESDQLRTFAVPSQKTGQVALYPELPTDFKIGLLNHLGQQSQILVHPGSELNWFAIPLQNTPDGTLYCAGYVTNHPVSVPTEITLEAIEYSQPDAVLKKWRANIPYCPPTFLHELLKRIAPKPSGQKTSPQEDQECRQSSVVKENCQNNGSYLSDTKRTVAQSCSTVRMDMEYLAQENRLLRTLTKNFRNNIQHADLMNLCLHRTFSFLKPAGIEIWIKSENADSQIFRAGKPVLKCQSIAQLLKEYSSHHWSQPLVVKEFNADLVSNPKLKEKAKGVHSFALIPMMHERQNIGWMILSNLSGNQELRNITADWLQTVSKVISSCLRILADHEDQEKVLFSFVKSLISTLDAKDATTRGHSERVALVARRLAIQMKLPKVEIDTIYLAGLLHDVGKVGIDDRILKKEGSLTDQEYEEIKRHPGIGYDIIKNVKQLQHVIPGVRSHHERWDGKGYPDNLESLAIPLMARILALADGYDAMRSDRTYRQGMPLEKIEDIFQKGAGGQWDPNVVEAYFACKDEIFQIMAEYDSGVGRFHSSPELDVIDWDSQV